MSDNEIKPAGWASDDGRLFETEAEARRNAWNSASPIYDQSAIDRLTAERDALRAQLDWTVRENDRLLDEGRDSAAERDAAAAIAQAFDEAKALAAERDPARLVAYDWIESRAAMIAAARAQEPQA